MMLRRQGFTLMELMVVLIIIGVVAAFFFPNFTTPSEQARAANAQNNLLAIYSAQQNYNNNNGGNGDFALGAGLAGTLALINSTLSLNIQDDGTYLYDCGVTTANACTATRTSISTNNTIVLTLNSAINLSGSGSANPQCNLSNNWCPP
jgi:prepilin-type N-terminal cleavage/methylation domain-containing protein